MPTFTNLKGLYNYGLNSTIKCAGSILDDIVEILRDFTKINVYQKYSPTEYDRTFELIDSISKRNFKQISKNKYQAEIFFDDKKIKARRSDGMWNFHMSIDGIDISASLPFWIEEGTNGSLWDRDGAYMVRETERFLKKTNKLNVLLRKELLRKGFKVVYVR